MNDEIKARIAALPKKAPAAAVIAAWAGETPWIDHRMCAKGHEPTSTCGEWVPWHMNDGRTLRRWLRDGGMKIVEYSVNPDGTYFTQLHGYARGTWEATEKTPETAFSAAIEKFAAALREA